MLVKCVSRAAENVRLSNLQPYYVSRMCIFHAKFSIYLICELVHSGSQPALHVIVAVVKTITPR